MLQTDLPTGTAEGDRKWIYPLPAFGRWHLRRKISAWGLIAWLLAAPWLKVGGHQAVFFDLVNRKIHFLGLTFWVNEMIVFLLFTLAILVGIVLLTVVLGRVFCGWACPITVFMEFVFRPIERLLEGAGAKQRAFRSWPFSDRIGKALIKWSLFVFIAVILGNTFVAYFMGSHRLVQMVTEGPSENWGPFVFMLVSSGLILFQYGWFREQVCLFVCPYGRLQSVLLDRDSLIVSYDKKRGEPRGKKGSTTGDCIDCKLCVNVCPTGIDIRQGTQLECIHCTQCIDACDSIMDKIARPRGLIRYQTESEVEGQAKKFLRPRLAIYLVAFAVISTALVRYHFTRADFKATLHRESGNNIYTIDSENYVINPVRVHLTNMTEKDLEIQALPIKPASLQIVSPDGVIHLRANEKMTVHLIVKLPREEFRADFGLREVEFKVRDQFDGEADLELRAVGPAQ